MERMMSEVKKMDKDWPAEMSMDEVYFKIAGYRPGSKEPVRRGLKIKITENMSIEEYMSQFEEAIAALLRHEVESVNRATGANYSSPCFKEIKFLVSNE